MSCMLKSYDSVFHHFAWAVHWRATLVCFAVFHDLYVDELRQCALQFSVCSTTHLTRISWLVFLLWCIIEFSLKDDITAWLGDKNSVLSAATFSCCRFQSTVVTNITPSNVIMKSHIYMQSILTSFLILKVKLNSINREASLFGERYSSGARMLFQILLEELQATKV
jgi:hypothetical protein